MNIFFHFLFGYLFVDIVLGNAWDYLLIIFIFSVLIDLTHIPYLIRTGSEVVRKRFGSGSRTRFHEMYGLALFSFVLCFAFFVFDAISLSVAALCLLLHFSLDFISGESMPFYPFSRKRVFLGMLPYSYRNKVIFEAGSTLLLMVIFWLRFQSLVL